MMRSLRAKIMLGFTIVVLLVTFIAAWTVVNVGEISEKIVLIGNWDDNGAEATDQMRMRLAEYDAAVLRYILRHDDTMRIQVAERQSEFYQWLNRANDNSIASEVQMLDDAEELFRGLNAQFTRIVEASAVPGNSEATMSYYWSFFHPASERLMVMLNHNAELTRRRSNELIDSVQSTARFIAYSTLGIAIMVLVVSTIASQKVLQTILRPIQQLTFSAQRVAEGDFEQEIKVGESYDELHALVEHFNEMVRRLEKHNAVKVNQLMTEKRRCETIVRDLSDAIVATDEDGRIIYFNRQAEDVIDLPATLTVGSLLSDMGAERPFIRRIHGDISDRRTGGVEEMLMFNVKGEHRSYAFESQTIHDKENEILGYVFRLKDITKFRQLDEIKNKMVSTVSHELRTPLTSIGLSLELLLEEKERTLEPLQQELLQNMQEDVLRLQGFVNDLLDIARIESGKVRLNLTPCAPRHLADDAVRRIAPMAVRQEIQIDTTGIAADMPTALVDDNRIAQVFSNLYSNAIRYTPFRGSIIVSADMVEGTIRFCVRDNGPGIPQNEARHIFEKFYQVRDDQRAGGSGLGLAIVKEIVEAHGGAVWVESAIGMGSSFYFTVPCA